MRILMMLCGILCNALLLALLAERPAVAQTSLTVRSYTIGAGASSGNLDGAVCPAPTKMISGACHPFYSDQVPIINQYPNVAGNTWRCGFKNNTAATASVYVYTLCAASLTSTSVCTPAAQSHLAVTLRPQPSAFAGPVSEAYNRLFTNDFNSYAVGVQVQVPLSNALARSWRLRRIRSGVPQTAASMNAVTIPSIPISRAIAIF